MLKKLLIFLIILIFASFYTSFPTRAFEISALMEFQLIDLGAPWVGGQLLLDTSPEIPGRSIQPDNVSLTYVLKPTNYTGKILRGSLVYDMGGDLYSGVGAGWGQIGPVSFLFGQLKSGINIQITDFFQLRGELIAYIPIRQLKEEDKQEKFFGANIGFSF